MKALSLYITSFNRYRRSRGFGVHSPFAYYFIKRVIKEQWGYYAYEDIDKAARREKVSRSEARLLFRVANYFNLPSILVATENEAAVTALKSVSSDTQIIRTSDNISHDMQYLDNLEGSMPFMYLDTSAAITDDKLIHLMKEIITRQGIVVIGGMKRCNRTRRLLKEAESGMKRGMTFSNGTTAVIIGDNKLPRQRFSLWF
ncbi:MAG: hypothetical protein DBY35_03720 [Bacteroidales bacterium]|nr:MAG: hypothetical protein DBY35_03720 [Bacteroidales bacterium]